MKVLKKWWSEQYATDQAAILTISFCLIVLAVGTAWIVLDFLK